jgi:hypothetical protein
MTGEYNPEVRSLRSGPQRQRTSVHVNPVKAGFAAEQAEQPGDDEIDGDDVVEQAGHDQNQDSGEQGDERREAEIDVHGGFLVGVPGVPVPPDSLMKKLHGIL